MMEALFICQAILSIILFWWGTGRDRMALVCLTAWAAALAIVSYYGFFARTDVAPPRIIIVPLISTALVIWLYRRLRNKVTSPRMLLAIHIIRIPVELTLYQLYLRSSVPRIMTFAGWNYDILAGVSALLILVYSLWSGRQLRGRLFRLWNIFGLLTLAIIVVTAILSAPSPFQQLALDQPNIAILHFPYTLLPGIIVPLVLLSHLLSMRLQK